MLRFLGWAGKNFLFLFIEQDERRVARLRHELDGPAIPANAQVTPALAMAKRAAGPA